MTEHCQLIGIAGPSCSGKSTVAAAILDYLGDAVLVQADSYYRNLSRVPAAKRAELNFDHPDAIDHRLLAADLRTLMRGGAVECPTYDFLTHTRASKVVPISSRPYVVVEGLWVLHWREVRELLSLSIMLAADHDTCLGRRLMRDSVERGRDPAFVRAQYERDVRPMCDEYLLPSGRHADIHIDGTASIDLCVTAARRAVRDSLLI